MTDKMLSPHLLEFLATLKDELVNLNNQAERLYFLEILMEQVVETLERNAQTGADKARRDGAAPVRGLPGGARAKLQGCDVTAALYPVAVGFSSRSRRGAPQCGFRYSVGTG